MIDLVLIKEDMLHYMQDLRAMEGMERGLFYHYIVLCKVRLVSAWIKRREIVNETRRIRRKNSREHHYIERYYTCLVSNAVKWGKVRCVEQIWKQVK